MKSETTSDGKLGYTLNFETVLESSTDPRVKALRVAVVALETDLSANTVAKFAADEQAVIDSAGFLIVC